jgi:hypothetical protein
MKRFSLLAMPLLLAGCINATMQVAANSQVASTHEVSAASGAKRMMPPPQHQCSAAEPLEVGTTETRAMRPHMAFQPDGSGLIAWPVGENTLRLRSISGDRLGSPVEADLDHAVNLQMLEPLGQRFLAIVNADLCGRFATSCVRARGFDATGAPTGAPYEPEARDQWADITAHAHLDDALVIAQAFRYDGRIDLLRLGAAGEVVVERHRLRADCTGDSPIRELTNDHGTVVALGSTDCSLPPNFLLSLGGRRQPVRSLPARARVEHFSSDAGIASIVFRAPRLRPQLLRLSTADGSVHEAARPLATHFDIPPDLQHVVHAEARIARGQLTLFRRDLAGAPLGQPFPIAPLRGRAVIEVVQTGIHFDVLWATRIGRTWHLYLRRMTCS